MSTATHFNLFWNMVVELLYKQIPIATSGDFKARFAPKPLVSSASAKEVSGHKQETKNYAVENRKNEFRSMQEAVISELAIYVQDLDIVQHNLLRSLLLLFNRGLKNIHQDRIESKSKRLAPSRSSGQFHFHHKPLSGEGNEEIDAYYDQWAESKDSGSHSSGSKSCVAENKDVSEADSKEDEDSKGVKLVAGPSGGSSERSVKHDEPDIAAIYKTTNTIFVDADKYAVDLMAKATVYAAKQREKMEFIDNTDSVTNLKSVHIYYTHEHYILLTKIRILIAMFRIDTNSISNMEAHSDAKGSPSGDCELDVILRIYNELFDSWDVHVAIKHIRACARDTIDNSNVKKKELGGINAILEEAEKNCEEISRQQKSKSVLNNLSAAYKQNIDSKTMPVYEDNIINKYYQGMENGNELISKKHTHTVIVQQLVAMNSFLFKHFNVKILLLPSTVDKGSSDGIFVVQNGQLVRVQSATIGANDKLEKQEAYDVGALISGNISLKPSREKSVSGFRTQDEDLSDQMQLEVFKPHKNTETALLYRNPRYIHTAETGLWGTSIRYKVTCMFGGFLPANAFKPLQHTQYCLFVAKTDVMEEFEDALSVYLTNCNASQIDSQLTDNNMKICELYGWSGSVHSMAQTFDGKYLFTGCSDGFIYIWDLNKLFERRTKRDTVSDGDEVQFPDAFVRKLGGHRLEVTTLLIDTITTHTNAADGTMLESHTNYLFSGSADGYIRVWDLHRLDCIAVLTGHEKTITTMVLSSSRRLFPDKPTNPVDKPNQGMRNSFASSQSALYMDGFGGVNQYLCSGGEFAEILVWRVYLPAGREQEEQELKFNEKQERVKNRGGRVSTYHVTPVFKLLKKLKGHDGDITALVIHKSSVPYQYEFDSLSDSEGNAVGSTINKSSGSKRGYYEYLYSGSSDGAILVWDLNNSYHTVKQSHICRGNEPRAKVVDGEGALATSSNAQIDAYARSRTPKFRNIHTIVNSDKSPVLKLHICNDVLYGCAQDNVLRVWDINPLGCFELPRDSLTRLDTLTANKLGVSFEYGTIRTTKPLFTAMHQTLHDAGVGPTKKAALDDNEMLENEIYMNADCYEIRSFVMLPRGQRDYQRIGNCSNGDVNTALAANEISVTQALHHSIPMPEDMLYLREQMMVPKPYNFNDLSNHRIYCYGANSVSVDDFEAVDYNLREFLFL